LVNDFGGFIDTTPQFNQNNAGTKIDNFATATSRDTGGSDLARCNIRSASSSRDPNLLLADVGPWPSRMSEALAVACLTSLLLVLMTMSALCCFIFETHSTQCAAL
jgi:hypothetical protein